MLHIQDAREIGDRARPVRQDLEQLKSYGMPQYTQAPRSELENVARGRNDRRRSAGAVAGRGTAGRPATKFVRLSIAQSFPPTTHRRPTRSAEEFQPSRTISGGRPRSARQFAGQGPGLEPLLFRV